MRLHRDAKLGLRGRLELVLAIERGYVAEGGCGRFQRVAGDGASWWHRWRSADAAQRRSLSCLHDRSSRPHCCPRLLAPGERARIGAVRRRSGWGPRLIAGATGHAHATVWRTLRRAGLSRRPRSPRGQVRRYEWPCRGDLLHIDTKRFSRFSRPGHAVTGVRDRSWQQKRQHVGIEFVHSIVDDRSRLAHSELRRDERAATVTAFVERALTFFASHSITPQRRISNNASTYTHNRALATLLDQHSTRHLLIPPHRPQVNGKESSATSKHSSANGPSARPPAPPTTAPQRCHTGSTTTTHADPTAPSADTHRSAAFTTS